VIEEKDNLTRWLTVLLVSVVEKTESASVHVENEEWHDANSPVPPEAVKTAALLAFLMMKVWFA